MLQVLTQQLSIRFYFSSECFEHFFKEAKVLIFNC